MDTLGPHFGRKYSLIYWYHVLVIFRWPGPNFGPKLGQKICANGTNIRIESSAPAATRPDPAKKVVAGPEVV